MRKDDAPTIADGIVAVVRETLGPAEQGALRRGALWGGAAFTVVAAVYAAAGLGFVAAFLDGAVVAWLTGSAGLLTGLQDGSDA